jgi:tyrosine-protein phosphatase SIW14
MIRTRRIPLRPPGSRRSKARAALVLFSLSVACAAPPNAGTAPDIRNFHAVNEHLFRGAQPSPLGLQELGALGVQRVIDLRERSSATAFEEKQLKKLGIEYVNIPMAELSAPSDQQIQTVLQLLGHAETSTFIHCRRGKDRTGTAIACYRVQHDGWDNRRALREAKSYGMSSFERSMQHYILHFAPSKVPSEVPVPMRSLLH